MKNIEPTLFEMPIEKAISATNACSKGMWQAFPNNSHSESYREQFGARAGYVVCYENRRSGKAELTALCSVIGQPFILQREIDANARLIELAPEMAKLIEGIAVMNEDHFKDINGFILEARRLAGKLII